MSLRIAIAGILCAASLTGCATGRELNGSWFLLVGRDGACRQVVHEAKTDQLDTRTAWRGKKCKPQPTEPQATDPASPNPND